MTPFEKLASDTIAKGNEVVSPSQRVEERDPSGPTS